MRTFNALESAVAAINEIIRQQDSKETSSQAAPSSKLEELVSASFEDALTTLAASDFDRALLLAQQLDGEEAPVLAQLAVLRGGLVEKQARIQWAVGRSQRAVTSRQWAVGSGQWAVGSEAVGSKIVQLRPQNGESE